MIQLTLVLIFIAFFVFQIAARWKILEKAGEPGWACLIPIYGTLVLLKIVGKPWWWLLLFCIPFAGIVWAIWTVNMLSKSFGKDEGFTIGMLILGFIFVPILGFGDAVYLGPFGDPVAFQAAQNPHLDIDGPAPL